MKYKQYEKLDSIHSSLKRGLAVLTAIQHDGRHINEGFGLSHEIIINCLWGVEIELRNATKKISNLSKKGGN